MRVTSNQNLLEHAQNMNMANFNGYHVFRCYLHLIPIISFHSYARIMYGRVLAIAQRKSQVIKTELLLSHQQMFQLIPLDSISEWTIFVVLDLTIYHLRSQFAQYIQPGFREWGYSTPCYQEKQMRKRNIVIKMRYARNLSFPDDLEQEIEKLWIVEMLEHWK